MFMNAGMPVFSTSGQVLELAVAKPNCLAWHLKGATEPNAPFRHDQARDLRRVRPRLKIEQVHIKRVSFRLTLPQVHLRSVG